MCPLTQDLKHEHDTDCGHPGIRHNGHVDYIVEGRLHHRHGDHCDDHGPIDVNEKLPADGMITPDLDTEPY